MTNSALEKLEKKWEQGKFVCVGLDPDLSKISVPIFEFNQRIIDQTADIVCAFKPQISFFEAAGVEGWKALEQTISYIKKNYPDILTILDAKRADIASTNQGYVDAYFKNLGFDALTVHPYLGQVAMQPFLDQKEKLIFVLVRTTSEGAGEFQELEVSGTPLYLKVAQNVAESWNKNGNCGVVGGALHPEELKNIRKVVGKMPILIPGVGAQGGDLKASVQNGIDEANQGIIINSSRAIIFAQSPRDAALKLHQDIQEALNK